MSGRTRVLRLLLAGFLAVWCGLFLRAENTAKSQVRVVVLEHTGPRWTAGLLYQFPDASADASDAAAEVGFCAGAGDTPALALAAAEQELPQQAGYRLCTSLLLTQEITAETLQTAERFFAEKPLERRSVRVIGAETSCTELLRRGKEDPQLPAQLLRAVEKAAADAPRLYERRLGLLIPLLEKTAETAGEALLVSGTQTLRLPADEAKAAQLLQGRSGDLSFSLDSGVVAFRRCVVSVEERNEGFFILLTGQRRAGGAPPSAQACEELADLCTRTVEHCWAAGVDLLRLEAVHCLKRGGGAGEWTTKSACPQLRTDVIFMTF